MFMSVALLFVFLVSSFFTLFSWEGESMCLELELQMVNYMQLWDDRMSRNMWDF